MTDRTHKIIEDHVALIAESLQSNDATKASAYVAAGVASLEEECRAELSQWRGSVDPEPPAPPPDPTPWGAQPQLLGHFVAHGNFSDYRQNYGENTRIFFRKVNDLHGGPKALADLLEYWRKIPDRRQRLLLEAAQVELIIALAGTPQHRILAIESATHMRVGGLPGRPQSIIAPVFMRIGANASDRRLIDAGLHLYRAYGPDFGPDGETESFVGGGLELAADCYGRMQLFVEAQELAIEALENGELPTHGICSGSIQLTEPLLSSLTEACHRYRKIETKVHFLIYSLRNERRFSEAQLIVTRIAKPSITISSAFDLLERENIHDADALLLRAEALAEQIALAKSPTEPLGRELSLLHNTLVKIPVTPSRVQRLLLLSRQLQGSSCLGNALTHIACGTLTYGNRKLAEELLKGMKSGPQRARLVQALVEKNTSDSTG